MTFLPSKISKMNGFFGLSSSEDQGVLMCPQLFGRMFVGSVQHIQDRIEGSDSLHFCFGGILSCRLRRKTILIEDLTIIYSIIQHRFFQEPSVFQACAPFRQFDSTKLSMLQQQNNVRTLRFSKPLRPCPNSMLHRGLPPGSSLFRFCPTSPYP